MEPDQMGGQAARRKIWRAARRFGFIAVRRRAVRWPNSGTGLSYVALAGSLKMAADTLADMANSIGPVAVSGDGSILRGPLRGQ
jgi:hypothetical protein